MNKKNKVIAKRLNIDKIYKSTGESEDEDAQCLQCGGYYSDDKKGEQWVKCIKCCEWAHEKCNSSNNASFICDICLCL